MPKKRTPIPIISEDELRSIIASVAMECGPFMPDEIAELRRVANGEVTVERSIQELHARIDRLRRERPELFGRRFNK